MNVAVLLIALVVGASALVTVPARPASAQSSPVVPAQFIAKQYSELLGRAPSPAEWDRWVAHFTGQGCTAGSLREMGLALADPSGTDAFEQIYPAVTPVDRATRAAALIRAAYNRDLGSWDWTSEVKAYAAGTRSWSTLVSSVYGFGFAAYLKPVICGDPGSGTTPGGSYGFDPAPAIDVRQRIIDELGASGLGSRTQAELQDALNKESNGVLAGDPAFDGIVSLRVGEIVRVAGSVNGNAALTVPTGVRLTTDTAPAWSTPTPAAAPNDRLPETAYARFGRIVIDTTGAPPNMICAGYICTNLGLVNVAAGAQLDHVWVDTKGADRASYKVATIDVAGSGDQPSTTYVEGPTKVLANRVTDPVRDGVGIRTRGHSLGSPCTGELVAGNVVSAYTSQNRFDELGQALWADGIVAHCEGSIVEHNTVIDATDSGITLHGSVDRAAPPYFPSQVHPQTSTVRANRVLNAGLSAHVALGADAMGECRAIRGGLSVPCLDVFLPRTFSGAITANRYWTGQAVHFDIGLMLGGDPLWGEHRIVGSGLNVTNNTTPDGDPDSAPGDSIDIVTHVNIGVSRLGLVGGTFSGNTTVFTDKVDGAPSITFGKCPIADVVVPGDANAAATDGCLIGEGPLSVGGRLAPIGVAANGDTLVFKVPGSPAFRPLGYNYALEIEDFWSAEWRAVVNDVREVRRQGGNTIRLILQTTSMLSCEATASPGTAPLCTPAGGGTGKVVLNQANINRLKDLANLAEQTGLYLDVTGLGIDLTFDTGDWHDATTDTNQRWLAQELFWSSVATAVGAHPAVAWFGLMNEPAVPGSPEESWCAEPTLDPAYDVCWVQNLARSTTGFANGTDLLASWVDRLTTKIRAANPGDPKAPTGKATPIGVGAIIGPFDYTQYGDQSSDCGSGWKQLVDAGPLDIMLVHQYPPATTSDSTTNPPGSHAWTVEEQADFVESCKPATGPMIIEELAPVVGSEEQVEAFILDARTRDVANSNVESAAVGATGWLGQLRAERHGGVGARLDLLTITSSFDAGTGSTGWTASRAALTVPTTPPRPAHSQSKAAQLMADGSGPVAFYAANSTTNWAKVRSGETYEVKGWVNGDVGGDWRAKLDWYAPNGSQISTATGAFVATIANQWTKVGATFTAPAGAGFGRLRLESRFTPISGQRFLIDDVAVLGDCRSPSTALRAMTPSDLNAQAVAYNAAGGAVNLGQSQELWSCEGVLALTDALVIAQHSMYLRNIWLLQQPLGMGALQP